MGEQKLNGYGAFRSILSSFFSIRNGFYLQSENRERKHDTANCKIRLASFILFLESFLIKWRMRRVVRRQKSQLDYLIVLFFISPSKLYFNRNQNNGTTTCCKVTIEGALMKDERGVLKLSWRLSFICLGSHEGWALFDTVSLKAELHLSDVKWRLIALYLRSFKLGLTEAFTLFIIIKALINIEFYCKEFMTAFNHQGHASSIKAFTETFKALTDFQFASLISPSLLYRALKLSQHSSSSPCCHFFPS